MLSYIEQVMRKPDRSATEQEDLEEYYVVERLLKKPAYSLTEEDFSQIQVAKKLFKRMDERMGFSNHKTNF